MPTITIQETTLEHAQAVAGLLDFASVETNRLTGSDPMMSLCHSQTAWLGDIPLCSFNISPPEGRYSASAWLMMTVHVKQQNVARKFLGTLREILADGVREYGELQGAAWIKGDAPRMLSVVGARFALNPNHPEFICWSLVDNYKLRRVG